MVNTKISSKPLVSVLINNYNYGKFLCNAIDSALQQNYSNIEVIVVDDGSTDDSRKIIKNYRDKIIPILKENGGQASAFNTGFALSKGELIFFLDADDIFMPEKVTEIVKIFVQNHDIDWCFHDQKLIDSKGNEINTGNSKKNMDINGKYDLRKAMRRGQINRYLPAFGLPATSALCFRRSLLNKILPMPELISIVSDNYIKELALAFSPGFITCKRWSIQKIHDNNAYTNRRDKLQVNIKIFMLTAYFMRSKFPWLSQHTNNTFAMALALEKKYSSIKNKYQDIVDKYLNTSTKLDKLMIYLKILYYQVKWHH